MTRSSTGHREADGIPGGAGRHHPSGETRVDCAHWSAVLRIGAGAADPGLAVDAAAQVAGAALDLDRWPTPRVLTSPARRCQQTAAVLLGCGLSWANGCGEPSIEPGISEVDFGRWEGLSSAQARAMDPPVGELAD